MRKKVEDSQGNRKRTRIDKRYFFLAAIIFGLTATISFSAMQDTERSSAADVKNFRAGDIISDAVVADYASLTESEIQAFLKSKAKCDQRPDGNHVSNVQVGYFSDRTPVTHHVVSGHYVCMADESFNGESAAHIIYQAAQDYRINPKVLIVVLQKEQGLVTDEWPNSLQYRSATGYGCPDTAVCDSQYYGFKNQVRNTAYFFRYILDNGSRYYPVGNNYVQYNPNSGCGGTTINIVNRATSALYQYTPYQPNAAALNARYGTGDGCSAYGNRNFWMYYTDWFGDTHTTSSVAKIEEAIKNTYSKIGSSSNLGNAVTGLQRNTNTGIFWIQYQNGYIVGSAKTGYYESRGKIRTVWQKAGFESGKFGFPISNIETNSKTGINFQYYTGGVIVGNDKYGYYESIGKIRDYWAKAGFESGKFGFPVSDIGHNPSTGVYWQYFTGGTIVGTDKYGYFESYGKIRDVWAKANFESGVLGYPVSNIETNSKTGIYFQYYTGGVIVGNDKYGYYESRGRIRETWQRLGFESGALGFPTSSILRNPGTGIYFQYYTGGAIVGNDAHGYFESRGKIREYWAKNNYEYGKFGFPTSNIKTNGDVQSQTYEHGTIYYNVKTGAVWS